MKRKLSLLFAMIILISSVFCGCSSGDSSQVTSTDTDENNITITASLEEIIGAGLTEAYVDNVLGKYGFSGTMLISKDGKVIYEKSMGFADPEKNIPNTSDTRYQIGSLTKQITSAAILQLESRQQLSTGDTLDKYFDGYEYLKEIKISDLLAMKAGFTDYIKFAEDKSVVKEVTRLIENNDEKEIKEYITALILDNGIRSDSKEFSYNNSCYYLLGLIIEKASSMSYRDYINNNIFKPANMSDSGYAGDGLDMASGYKESVNGEFSSDNAKYGNVFVYPFMFSAGSVVSTARDVNNWLYAFSSGKIIDKKRLEKIYNSKDDYCYGWHKSNGGLFHVGNTNSYTAIDYLNIEKKIAVTILSNIGMYKDIESLAKELCKGVFDDDKE